VTKDEALRLALEALEKISMGSDPRWADQAITAIEAALEAKDEPVQNQLMALIDENQRLRAELKFNTNSPQRKPLMDEQLKDVMVGMGRKYGGDEIEFFEIARAIEAAHGIKEEA
jgi:hypothetical protein